MKKKKTFWQQAAEHGERVLARHFEQNEDEATTEAIMAVIEQQPEYIACILSKEPGLNRLFGQSKKQSPSGYGLISLIYQRMKERRSAA